MHRPWIATGRSGVLVATLLLSGCVGSIGNGGGGEAAGAGGSPATGGRGGSSTNPMNTGGAGSGTGGAMSGTGGAGSGTGGATSGTGGAGSGTGGAMSGTGGAMSGTGGAGGSSPGPGPTLTLEERIAARPLRRLRKAEIVATLADVFGAATLDDAAIKAAVDEIADDPDVDLVDAPDDLGQAFVQDHRKLAFLLAGKVATTPALLTRFSGGCAVARTDDACFRTFVGTLGRLLARRPLQPAELDRYVTRVRAEPVADALKIVTTALLRGPDFLFHLELGDDATTTNVYRLTSYEVASRLSYATIGSLPDAALFDAAAQSKLGSSAELGAHARRLLAMPQARGYLRRFLDDWLKLLPASDPDPVVAQRAGITAAGFGAEALEELHRAVEQVVWTEGGNLNRVLTSPSAFPYTDRLAKVLGVPKSTAGPVAVPAQAGLVLRPAILMSTHPETSPILRGAFVLKRLMCMPIPDPPEDLDIDAEVQSKPVDPTTMSMRVRTDLITSSSICTGCHRIINPVGYALEGFGPLGAPRTVEAVYDATNKLLAEHTIDTTVTALIAGESRTLRNAADLIDVIATKDDAGACMARHLFEFTRLRRSSATDDLWINTIGGAIKAGKLLDALADAVAQDDMLYARSGS